MGSTPWDRPGCRCKARERWPCWAKWESRFDGVCGNFGLFGSNKRYRVELFETDARLKDYVRECCIFRVLRARFLGKSLGKWTVFPVSIVWSDLFGTGETPCINIHITTPLVRVSRAMCRNRFRRIISYRKVVDIIVDRLPWTTDDVDGNRFDVGRRRRLPNVPGDRDRQRSIGNTRTNTEITRTCFVDRVTGRCLAGATDPCRSFHFAGKERPFWLYGSKTTRKEEIRRLDVGATREQGPRDHTWSHEGVGP